MDELHKCLSRNYDSIKIADYGGAVYECSEDTDGVLWVTNYEYTTQVNYCPFCGYKAKVQVSKMENK